MTMPLSPQDQFNELSYYTMGHPDTVYFIHQHAVDAFHAQTADVNTKPIRLVFSLIGLYLYLEKMYSGRQVQQAHMVLAPNNKSWILPDLPEQRGAITVSHVLKAAPGQQRDLVINAWCSSVWAAYKHWHEIIATHARMELRLK
jgi:hypothetical protein